MAVITELDSYTIPNQLGFEEQRMLQDYIASEIDQHSDDYEKLVQFFIQSTQSQVDFEEIDLQPQPGFVCKTRIVQNAQNKNSYPTGTVIYINVTYNLSGHVLIDAVMNTQAMSRCLRDFDYKVWVIELVIEYAEQVLDVKLSRQFDIPTAIAVKGGMPEPIRLRLPTEVFVSKMIKEINKKKEWQLKPSIQKRGDEMVVLIDMPDEDDEHWKTEVNKDQLFLTINQRKHIIPLRHSIDRDSPLNTIDFYKKSKKLVCVFQLLKRSQYL
ncbi:hypothetical protein G6F19_007367 [Rhizopus arrhizus]|nr:hypothetical protein G6F19_007367 [Rhizopus arrhizus]KAG1036970.1 hypothetical protein G6F25_007577 [Rhizopus arrhizus]